MSTLARTAYSTNKGEMRQHAFTSKRCEELSPFSFERRISGSEGVHNMKIITALLCSAVAGLAGGGPTGDEIMARVLEADHARQSNIGAYSVTSKYVLQNKDRHAEMVVRWTRQANGIKDYVVLSEGGDRGVRKHVFYRLLEAEVEASQPGQRARARITPDNYSFALRSTEKIEGNETYVIDLEPKTENKYLTRGRIWVDGCDYSVVRMEGAPAHKVSFWTKDVNFVQTFEKNGSQWVAASNHSLTNARLFGLVDLTIEYSEYEFSKAEPVQAELAVEPIFSDLQRPGARSKRD